MDEYRIGDKIIEIEQFLEELESDIPDSLERYKGDFKTKAICERYFEKIIEAVVDLAFLVVKDKGLKQPEYEKEVFDILADRDIISKELSKKLKDAKGMRNIISHQYGKIDDSQVFHSITEELIPDVQEFIKCVSEVK
ncbi:MAG: DUF86 domain-containing protein [archaeon]